MEKAPDEETALTAGLLSLLLTGSVMVFTLPLGMLILRWGWLDSIAFPALLRIAGGMGSGLDRLLAVVAWLPEWVLFLVGVGLVTLSFQLFDRALPQFKLRETELGLVHKLVYRPEVMFALGFLVTLATMSVSISIGILVPLSARGYLRREKWGHCGLNPYGVWHCGVIGDGDWSSVGASRGQHS